MWSALLVIALSAYMLGNINGAFCVSQLVAGEDVRKHGSGNAGLTNFFRNYGGWGTAMVVAVDVAKTVLACYVGKLILKPFGFGMEGAMLGAVAVTLGHDFPALLGFKGGKGILCGWSAALVLDWRLSIAMLAVFLVAFALTRYVSLGSLLGAVTCAIWFAVFYHDVPWFMAGGVCLGVLAIWMHKSNIVRLVKGTESKVHLIHRDLNKK